MGSGLVELIEAGAIHSPEMMNLLEGYLTPMLAANIDYLVLGCSHYPYLIPLLENLLPNRVTIIDSGAAVARQTQNILQKNQLDYQHQQSDHKFYSNADPKVLKNILDRYPVDKDVAYLEF